MFSICLLSLATMIARGFQVVAVEQVHAASYSQSIV
jgi:hypothetical protein